MKKIAAITLLGILAFNWYGYQFVSAWLEARADRQLISALDERSFLESDLILLKVPATHLTGYANRGEFERIDGKVEIGGIAYNYVERRINGDSIEFRCIPNVQANAIRNAGHEFYKLVNDLPQNAAGKNASQTHSFKGFTGDYLPAATDYALLSGNEASFVPAAHYLFPASLCLLACDEQPPDLA